MCPRVHLAGDLDEESNGISAVIGHTHRVVLPEAGLRNVDVGNRSHEVREFDLVEKKRIYGNLHVNEISIGVNLGDGTLARINADPADKFVDDVETDGDVANVLEVEGVRPEADQEENHHDLVQVEEEFPHVSTHPGDSSQHHRKPQRSGLQEKVSGVHKSEDLQVVGGALIVPVLVPEFGSAAHTAGDLHANQAEHDVDDGKPEGHRSVETVSGNDCGLKMTIYNQSINQLKTGEKG